jgi:glyoxylase I family protein
MNPSNSVISGCGFHHVAIRTSDWATTIGFYTDALGFREKISWGEAPKRAAMLDTGDGNYLEVFEYPEYRPDPNGAIVHFALRTDDCDTALERARSAGAEVTVEPKTFDIASSPVTPVRIAFCKGPEGAIIEFFQNELT